MPQGSQSPRRGDGGGLRPGPVGKDLRRGEAMPDGGVRLLRRRGGDGPGGGRGPRRRHHSQRGGGEGGRLRHGDELHRRQERPADRRSPHRPDGADVIHESICPRCGEPSRLGVCDRCRRGMAVLLQTPEAVELTVCPVCGSHPVRGRWQKGDEPIEDLISDAVAGEARIHQDLLDPEISISVNKRNATQYRATVTLSGKFGEIPAEEARTVEATVRQATCERCSRMAGNYYEATVQVRGSAGGPAPEEVEECRNIAERATETAFERGDRLSFIQETKVVKGGIDLVVGSTQQGRYIARAIHDRF
ncbi:MAG: hypothetical protein METHAR1v1_970001, partial [Methanothrix sp.]